MFYKLPVEFFLNSHYLLSILVNYLDFSSKYIYALANIKKTKFSIDLVI